MTKPPKIKESRELVRVIRANGWARQAIVGETYGRCYVVMIESNAFGSLKAAREYAKKCNVEAK